MCSLLHLCPILKLPDVRTAFGYLYLVPHFVLDALSNLSVGIGTKQNLHSIINQAVQFHDNQGCKCIV